MKLSPVFAAGLIVIALITIVVIGYFATRQATGGALADDIHAEMAKIPPGRGPSYGGNKVATPGAPATK